jgi:hypothetical protein
MRTAYSLTQRAEIRWCPHCTGSGRDPDFNSYAVNIRCGEIKIVASCCMCDGRGWFLNLDSAKIELDEIVEFPQALEGKK